MEKERIAAEVAEARSRVDSDGPYATGEQQAIVALADQLEAANTALATVTAERDAGRVVPEGLEMSEDLVDQCLKELCDTTALNGYMEENLLRRGFEEGVKASRIPASRVLGEGEVAVGCAAILKARNALAAMVIDRWHHGHCGEEVASLCLAFQPIVDALRARTAGAGGA